MISTQYLADVAKAYAHFFFHYTGAPVLVVDASKFDFQASPDDFRALLEQLDALESGTRHFTR
jgi:deoxyadenosine/deoxycytidine kinase